MSTQQDILKRSLAGCRMPIWRRGTASSRERIDQLEEYMLLTAWFRGEIAQELNVVLEDLDVLDDQYDALDISYRAQSMPKTDKGVAQAKYDESPDLCKRRVRLQKRAQRLRGEMDRLDREATICSRAYTLITGT